jgi:hypothetical protein
MEGLIAFISIFMMGFITAPILFWHSGKMKKWAIFGLLLPAFALPLYILKGKNKPFLTVFCSIGFICIWFMVTGFTGIALDTDYRNEWDKKEAAKIEEAEKPESKLKQVLKKQFGDNLTYTNISNYDDKPYTIIFSFEADPLGSDSDIIRRIENEYAESILALHKTGIPLEQVACSAYLPLQDLYGNEESKKVFTTTIREPVLNKVNWDREDFDLIHFILPRLWEKPEIHHALRD